MLTLFCSVSYHEQFNDSFFSSLHIKALVTLQDKNKIYWKEIGNYNIVNF